MGVNQEAKQAKPEFQGTRASCHWAATQSDLNRKTFPPKEKAAGCGPREQRPQGAAPPSSLPAQTASSDRNASIYALVIKRKADALQRKSSLGKD